MLTPKTFTEEILKRRKGIGEQDLKNIAALAQEVTPETLGAMLGAFDNYYTAEKPPGRSDIIKCAEKAGVKINKQDRNQYYQICQKCGTKYSTKSPGCPVCRKSTEIKVGAAKRLPEEYIELQEDCWICKLYFPGIPGPTCQNYGLGESIDLCGVCQCNKCCREAHIIKTNYKAYKQMMNNGEIENRRL